MNGLSTRQKEISSVLKIVVILSAIIGTFLSAYAGRHSFMGGSRVFMYFTIQSNIAIAVICCIGFFLMHRAGAVGRVWQVIKFVGTVSITLTGVVFCVMLAPTLGPNAWNIQNVLTHVVVPLAAVIDFFVVAVSDPILKKNVIFVIIPPILYAVYAGIGYVQGWEFADGINYPYFFLNWGSPAGAFGFTKDLPFLGSAWWILILLLFLLCVGYGYLTLTEFIGKKHNK
ncbi:MAG: Pr6Pr family membrane protein [Lachnospiraceae bacterium]|nr:Pr6Pr family membrane protein [Lachnospiraceae bacterium]